MSINIVNVGYRSTNFWVVSNGTARLLIDLGWPGMFGALQASLRRMGIPLAELRYCLATHYHIDHAGAAQELKLAGARLLVMESQVEWVARMKRWTKPQDNYLDITLDGNVTICSFQDSRDVLKRAGFAGEIIPTPGHSDDSVSLLLDDGSAFTGDLTPPSFISVEDGQVARASWRRLRDAGARKIYPGHGPVIDMFGDDELLTSAT